MPTTPKNPPAERRLSLLFISLAYAGLASTQRISRGAQFSVSVYWQAGGPLLSIRRQG